MTSDQAADEPPIGPLGRRLRLAFLSVAVLTVALVAAAAFVGTSRGLDAATREERATVAARVAETAASAYEAAGGWDRADLTAASASAGSAGADLVVLGADGQLVFDTTGAAPGAGGPSRRASGRGAGGGRVTAPILVGSTPVGTARLQFGSPASTAARTVAWWWIALAALVALGLALLAARLVTQRVSRPLAAVTATAQAFAAGDRRVRTGIDEVGEIGEVARALDAMADEVAASEQTRRRAAADVAHELRTPVAALQAGLEELRDGLVDPDTALLAGLHDQSLRLGRIVADLSALSAAEGGALRLRISEVDLAELARQATAAQEPQLRAAGLAVSVEAVHDVPVRGDADRLRQVVDNLLSNAGRYCRPGDHVTVRVTCRDTKAVLEVTDTGPGISADDLPHVFERLWRGQEADRVGGSGIGLAVVSALVAAHHGMVVAESDGRTGTSVRVELGLASD